MTLYKQKEGDRVTYSKIVLKATEKLRKLQYSGYNGGNFNYMQYGIPSSFCNVSIFTFRYC